MSYKRTLSSTSLDKDAGGKFLRPRDPQDLTDRMRPLELSDLVPPRSTPSARTGNNRKGRGAQSRDTEKRRNYTNANAQKDLNDHFAMKLNTVDEMREAFTLVGVVGPVTTPPHVIEIETAGVRDIITDSIRIVRAKVREDFFQPEFEPAMQHVTAHLVASKLQHSHLGAPTGSTRSEEIPGDLQLMEHVRMSSTTTFIGVAGYLESIGRFDVEGVRHTPYLRRLMHDDNKVNWVAADCFMHHMPQLYSETFRRQMAYPDQGTSERRAMMHRLGIPIPDPLVPGVDLPADIGRGRNIVVDLGIVRDHMERLSQKFPKCVKSVDVSTGIGSHVQLVAYDPPMQFEPTRVWSPLLLESMDLYVGAAFGFCVDRPGVPLPPELHTRVMKRQIHTTLAGSISNWINNLMSRG